MESKGFSIGEMLRHGWKGMKKQWVFFIFFLLGVFLLPMVPGALAALIAHKYYDYSIEQMHYFPMWINVVIWIFHAILTLLVGLGMIKVSLVCADLEKAKFRYLFSGFPLIAKFFIAGLLYYLIVAVGLILFVFPGVIWGLRYGQFGFFIVDRGVGPLEALTLSREATNGAKWDLFGFFIVSAVVNILGLLALLIGIFAVVPTVMIAQGFIFRSLVAKTLTATPRNIT